MAEVNIMVEGRLIEYDGLMDVRGFIFMLDQWFKDRTYNKREVKNFEEVYESGRQFTIEFWPYKKISDNVRFEFRLFMIFSKLKDVEIDRDGKKLKLQRGHAMISMDGYVITDYENKWDATPFYYFLRVIFDKYLYRNYINRARSDFLNDATLLEEEIGAYLNLFKYKAPAVKGDWDAPSGKIDS